MASKALSDPVTYYLCDLISYYLPFPQSYRHIHSFVNKPNTLYFISYLCLRRSSPVRAYLLQALSTSQLLIEPYPDNCIKIATLSTNNPTLPHCDIFYDQLIITYTCKSDRANIFLCYVHCCISRATTNVPCI